uniref:Uncharacterized protein n=1 Tax=Arundo donax TaxID=35708 RepID=A0A0A9C3Z4_ARUDO
MCLLKRLDCNLCKLATRGNTIFLASSCESTY